MTDRPRNVCPFCDMPAVSRTNFASTDALIAPFFDEDGHEHHHDSQGQQFYMCVDNHAWSGPMCWCGWGAKAIELPSWVKP